MKLTRELAIKLHRKLWMWVATETERQHRIVTSAEYPLFKRKKIYRNCWLCEFSLKYGHSAVVCNNCPIKWGEDRCNMGEYRNWYNETKWKKSARLARIIANLPENIGY